MMHSFVTKIKCITQKLVRNRSVFRLIGIIVFVLILLKIDLREALSLLMTVDPLFLMVSLGLQGLALVLTTFRWQLIMRRLEINIPFSRSLIHQLIGTAAAMVTPGQMGEFIKVLYHRGLGFPVPESLLSVLIDRACDLLLLLLLGLIALAVLFGMAPGLTVAVTVSGGIVLIAGLFLAVNKEGSRRWILASLVRISPRPYQQTVRRNTSRVAQRVGGFRPGFLSICALLSAVNYILLVLRLYFLILALHVDVPFWYFAMVVPLLRLVGLVPISVSGLGTRDITSIYLLAQVGIPKELSLVFSILGLLANEFQALVGLLAWWRYPPRLRKKDSSSPEELALRESV